MNKRDAECLALKIRIGIVEEIKARGFGHIGGSLSVADALATLYGEILKVDPANPKWPERDKVVFSRGMPDRRTMPRWRQRASFPGRRSGC